MTKNILNKTTPFHKTIGKTLRDPVSYVGTEWLVDALGCQAAPLTNVDILRSLLEEILFELGLHKVQDGLWNKFPSPGGVTGLYLLRESHLACHTYPEYHTATFNLYCCRPRAQWPWAEKLAKTLGASRVNVRVFHRGQETV